MTVRVGVIGVGAMGAAHARTLAGTVSGSAVSVVHDADRARAAAVAGELGARTVDSVEDVFAADDVDAVLLASPDGAHAEQVRIGLERRLPMLCEKPLATTEADARAVLEAELAVGRRLVQVGFMRRFDPGFVQLKRELGEDGIGEPLIVHTVHRNTFAPYGLRTEQTLTNMVIHEFDTNRWLLGEDYSSILVLAGKSGPLTPAGERDPLLIILRTSSDVLVEVEAFANDQYGYEVTCRVTGSLGQAVLGDGSYITRSKDQRRGVEVPELWLGRFADAYRIELQGWIDAVRGDAPPPGATVWDGFVASVVAARAIEAYRSGLVVPIDLPARPGLYD